MPINLSQSISRFLARLLRWTLVYLLFALRPVGPACGHDDEFYCEDAAQQLLSCCGGAPALHCTFSATGCKQEDAVFFGPSCSFATVIEPDLLPEAAQCIRDASCDLVQKSGACGVLDWRAPEAATALQRMSCPATLVDNNH